jgi:MOB kinase activator 1
MHECRTKVTLCSPPTDLTQLLSERYEYLWADGTKIKKPIKVSAPEYVDLLMVWVQEILDNESVFPSRVGERSA